MFNKVANFITLKSVDKDIRENNFETALSKLNFLIKEDFLLEESYLKRGMLCHKLLMMEDAYSDFTYVITHYPNNTKAFIERLKINYEIANYSEAISDANTLLNEFYDNIEFVKYKFLSYAFMDLIEDAKLFILNFFEQKKYRALQFIFNEIAKVISNDEFAKAFKLFEIIESMDPDNPIKVFKEANLYGLIGQKDKENELMKKLDSIFPKYFISHFRFTDMYQERDILETCFLLELKIFDKNNYFSYPMSILEGYKCNMEGHIIDSKTAFERAIEINPNKPEAYVLLAQTLQLMAGYDDTGYKKDAEENYKKALSIYERENLQAKSEDMKRQIKHLNSSISFK